MNLEGLKEDIKNEKTSIITTQQRVFLFVIFEMLHFTALSCIAINFSKKL